MSARTRKSFRNSQMSRAARAMFAFLFRNALPVDASLVRPELQTRRRTRERATVSSGVLTATTYEPSDSGPRRRRTDRPASAYSVTFPNRRAS